MDDLERRIAQARGDMPADLVLRGGQVFDLITGEMLTGDVAICGDRIAGIGAYDGARVIDVAGLNPITGATEPRWIAEEGAIVYDDTDTNGGSTSAGDDDTPQPPPDVVDRYRNHGGNLPAREV